LDVAQTHRLIGVFGVFGVDGTAEETIAVEHPDLRNIAGVVANGDALANEGSQGRIEIAQAAEPDAVTPDHAGSGHHEEQLVKFFQSFRHAWQPPLCHPSYMRGCPNGDMQPDIVAGNYEGADRRIEITQRQLWCRDRPASNKTAREIGE
jgi:hypothetical protein